MKCIPGHIRTGQPAGQIKHGRMTKKEEEKERGLEGERKRERKRECGREAERG